MKAGDRLAARYELVERIGEGGMGEVWRAQQVALGRAVAVKVIHPEHGADTPELRGRFQREAELAAKVDHRNVIGIIDYGTTEEGAQFLVMPFLRGATLEERLRRLPAPSLAEVARWTGALLGGLAAIHDRGIVHRDLKPANVFLAVDSDGVVPKLLDFGISRTTAEESSAGLTSSGTAIGTPQYMAPEQFESASDVDARADIYGIGAILFEAAVGSPPVEGTDAFAIYRRLLESASPRVQERRPEVPVSLAGVIEKAIAKDREARWATARAMRSALAELAEDGGLADVHAVVVPLATEDLESASTTPSSEAVAHAARTPFDLAAADTASPEEEEAPRRVAKTVGISAAESTYHTDDEGIVVAKAGDGGTGTQIMDGAESTTPTPQPLLAPAQPSPSRAPLYGGVGLVVALALGAAAFVLGSGADEEVAGAVDAGVGPFASEEVGDAGAEATGIRVSEPADLRALALAWARVPPTDRRAEVRFVPADGEWAIVAEGTTDAGDVARLAEGLGSSPRPSPWDPERGLRPQLSRTRVRLNVHVDPDVASETTRVLPHDTLVVALYGEIDEGTSTSEGRHSMTYFVASRAHAGWAVSRYVRSHSGCLPSDERLVHDNAAHSDAIREDLVLSRTRVRVAGRWADALLMSARDIDAGWSVVGVYEASPGCGVGEEIALFPLEGIADEYFFTETGREGGESLLLASWYTSRTPPEDGVLEWAGYRLEGDEVFRGRNATAPYLPRRAQGGVSGRRDRLLRRREDDAALAVRQPRGEHVFYDWDGELLTPQAEAEPIEAQAPEPAAPEPAAPEPAAPESPEVAVPVPASANDGE